MKRISHYTGAWLGICLTALSFGATAETPPVRVAAVTLDIKSQPIGAALNEFARQSGVQVLLYSDVGDGVSVPGFAGTFTPDAALTKLLSNTGLTYSYVNPRTVAIHRAVSTVSERTTTRREPERPAKIMRLASAQVTQTASEDQQANEDQQIGTAANARESDNNRRLATGLEEVIVTATKRETRLQDTAMSVSVLSSNEIEQRGLVGMGDYLSSVPGVSVLDQGAGYTSIVMRGLAANPNNDHRDGTLVGVYFDEIPISGYGSAGHTADIKMLDLQRVEVLKGPQGTLYGASSLGGTVRNISALPNLQRMEGKVEFAGSETAGFGSDNSKITGVLSVPIIEDSLAVRGVVYRFKDSGYYENVAASDPMTAAEVINYGARAVSRGDVGAADYTGGRLSLLWQPIEKMSLRLNYIKQDIDQSGWPQADLELGTDAFLQRRLQMRHADNRPSFGEPEFNEEFADKISIANAVLEYDLGWASLLSSSSWLKEDSKFFRDLSGFFGFIPWSQPQSRSADVFVQEIRLASQFDSPFQFVGGVYYEDGEIEQSNWGLWGGDPALNAFGAPDQVLFLHTIQTDKRKQTALFGELSYELTPQWKVTAGARGFIFDRSVIDDDEPALFSPGGIISSESDERDATYKAGVDFSPNSNTLVYASWSQGFRLGRPIAANTTPVCDQDSDGFFDGSGGVSTGAYQIDSDYVDSFEVGGKRSFLDNGLQLNASLYKWSWEGVPITVVFDFCNATLNAGKAESEGVEFDGSYFINEALSLSLGASYVNATLSEDAAFLGEAGDRLPGSPKYNFHAGLQYGFSVAGRESFFRGDYTYISGFYNNLQETGPEAGDFGMLNMRVGMSFGNLSAEVYGNNLTNKNALTWADSEGLGNSRGNILRPRTVGIQLGYSFE